MLIPLPIPPPRSAGEGAHLELTGIGGDRKMADEGFLGFAAASGHHRQPAGIPRHPDCINCFADRATLVELDEYAVGDLLVDALTEPFRAPRFAVR